MYLLTLTGIIFCAIQAFRARRLLTSALWLAGVSALVASMLYGLGAHEVAVIELSVGAGLVTVLFVFAISLVGDESDERQVVVPKPLAWALVLASVGLLAWQILPLGNPAQTAPPPLTFSQVLWQDRGLDVLLQIALIFAGALTVSGLLVEETRARAAGPAIIQEMAEQSTRLAPGGGHGAVPEGPSPEEAVR